MVLVSTRRRQPLVSEQEQQQEQEQHEKISNGRDSQQQQDNRSNNNNISKHQENGHEGSLSQAARTTMEETDTDPTSTSTTTTITTSTTTPLWVYMILGLFVMITIGTMPSSFHLHGRPPTVKEVFFYGWLTALSTGLGVLPFVIVPNVPTYFVGISNAIASGMMIAASYSLLVEGCTYSDPHDLSTISTEIRTGLGAFFGLIFILITKKFLDQYEDIKMMGILGGTDARKALLIFFVMTLHSFSEGIGIGVSFGGIHGNELGVFISASLAVHNIPEGIAIAVVFLPRGISILTATVWIIATSLPQPLMAVPAFLFVHYFIPVLPIGLGFAGGAMAYVAIFELLVEAIEDTNLVTTCLVATPSLVGMMLLQKVLDDGTR